MKEKEALQLIEQMISTAKNDLKENGFFFMLWGWTIFIAALVHFTLEIVPTHIHPALPWPVFTGIAGIISIFASRKQKREQRMKSYVETALTSIWTAFGISLFIALMILLNFAPLMAYPVVMLFYGFGTFTTGRILKFNPMIYGAFACWILAVVTAFSPFNIQLLLLAASVVISYIIPGHILQYRFNRHV